MNAKPALGPIDKYAKTLLVALGYRDKMTQMHSERVEVLSVALGMACGLSGDELNTLKIGASCHDIGKIGIPDRVLLKPARLDDDEGELMHQHSDIGEKILLSAGLKGAASAARVIRHHHEHFDGSGYPDRLAGENIPIASRIVAIVDSYDAMAVTRTYHKARKHEEIVDILQMESGTKHDPELLQLFYGMIESSPLKAGSRQGY